MTLPSRRVLRVLGTGPLPGSALEIAQVLHKPLLMAVRRTATREPNVATLGKEMWLAI